MCINSGFNLTAWRVFDSVFTLSIQKFRLGGSDSNLRAHRTRPGMSGTTTTATTMTLASTDLVFEDKTRTRLDSNWWVRHRSLQRTVQWASPFVFTWLIFMFKFSYDLATCDVCSDDVTTATVIVMCFFYEFVIMVGMASLYFGLKGEFAFGYFELFRTILNVRLIYRWSGFVY